MPMHSHSFNLRRFQEASARGKKMAEARWKQERERRRQLEAVAEIDPLRVPGRILQRVVVINRESQVTEIIRRDTTSQRDWAAMKRRVGL